MTAAEGREAADLLRRTMQPVLAVDTVDIAEQRFQPGGTDPRRRRRADPEI